ncbi:MAG: CocE/NonD family hydrolase [Eubacteriales bacterium]|nr:CocE/NonD family hydrolase [Eubacteriales bacterium]
MKKKQEEDIKTVLDCLNEKMKSEMPAPIYEKIVRREISITLSDGVRLANVAYFPAEEGKWPVVIHRTPYGPLEFAEHDVMGEIFAKQGYVFFISRCRGTGLSEGRICAFEQETEDGLEVLDYVSGQEWCNGNIGTYGASYTGHTQWAVAGTKNPALKTMYIQVFGGHPYETFYRNGMLRQDIWQSWLTGNGGNARKRSEEEALELHKKAFAVKPPANIGKSLLDDPVEWAVKTIINPQESDDTWQKGFWKEYEENVRELKLPILLQCGWYDIFCQSQLDTWRMLPKETREKSLCLVGPWNHYGFTNNVLPYPDSDRFGVMQVKTALQWFAHFLKGQPLELPTGGMETYCIGDNVWKFWKDDIKASEQVQLYLGSRSLEKEIPDSGSFTYTYNPQNPVDSLTLGLDKGTTVCPKAGKRESEGVFSFVSEELDKDMTLTGKILTELYVSSSASATAFALTLMDERTDGCAYLVLNDIMDIRYEKDRFVSYEPGTVKKIVLESQDIIWTFKKGSKIRIDISSSDFPWYNAHNNTEVVWGNATETVIAKNAIYFGEDKPSKIILPVM